jgi:hypothetical protein
MSDIPRNPTNEELAEHYHSFFAFERLMLFAALHVALTLSCAALAFIGHVHLVALLFWLGGTVVLLSAFALTGYSQRP